MAQIKDLERMCESYKTCDDCPLFRHNCFVIKTTGIICEIVDKWVNEHPIIDKEMKENGSD